MTRKNTKIWHVAVIVACLSLLLVGAASAATYFVSTTGNDDSDGKTLSQAWKTINNGDAKSILNPGDIVIVTDGTYPQATSGGVALTNCSGTLSAPITYKANGRVIIDQSVYSGSVSYCINVGVNCTIIEGFELKSAQFGVYLGGGPQPPDGPGATHDNEIRNCKIYGMRAPSPGSTDMFSSMCAGIYNSWAARNLIHHNVIYNIGTPNLVPTVGNNNWAFCIGGPACEDMMVFNNTLVNSWAGVMTWVSESYRSVIVANSIICDMWGYAINHNQGEYTIINDFNILYNNTVSYGGDALAGSEEIVADPQFADPGASDYCLTFGSPAVDSAIDVGFGWEYLGLAPDIGAFELLPDASAVNYLSEVKGAPVGTTVKLLRSVVASVSSFAFLDGSFYLQDGLGACGIKAVLQPGLQGIRIGDRVTVTGFINKDANDEPYLRIYSIDTRTAGNAPSALGMKGTSAAVSGKPNTTGLLMKVWGWVTYTSGDGSFICVDDGSGIVDPSGAKGVRVVLSGMSDPVVKVARPGQYVLVTGLAGLVKVGLQCIRAIHPRNDADFVCAIADPESELAGNWLDSKLGQTSQMRPFSFTYNGQPSSALLGNWQCSYSTRNIDGARTERTITYNSVPRGLQVRCVATQYADFPATEWVVYFKNTGSTDSGIIENIQALSVDFTSSVSGDSTLYYADGSKALISDFQPREALVTGTPVTIGSFGGRSSDGNLPFFNLLKPDGNGVVVGIGWTGQWAASIVQSAAGVNVQAGMEITHLLLHPGEEIRTPSVMALFYAGGDRWRGQNQLRRLLLQHYTPRKADGQLVDPPIAASPHAVIPFEGSTEVNMVQGINNIAARNVPFDYWWIDAGWYTCNGNWARYVGNFDPDPVRYPNGMAPVAAVAHSAGMKFLLWFEPERVMKDTWLFNNHPDWIIGPPNNFPPELMYQYNDSFCLLDLSNPSALAWLKSKVSGMISTIGIDIYRNDFNMYPSYYWRKNEAANRQGMKEIQYVTAFYDYMDTLRRDHPNLLIDNCASGGRRIDFEMLRRSLVLTRSDYLWDPIGQQSHNYGLSQWIPITGIGAADTSVYNCRSGLGSNFVLAGSFYSTVDSVWQDISRTINEAQSLKKYYSGDYYPIGQYSTADNVWMAWQFDRSDLGEGLLQAFRRPNSPVSTMTYQLKGLEPNAEYRVSYSDSAQTITLNGSDLMDQGISFTLAASEAAYVTYKKVQ